MPATAVAINHQTGVATISGQRVASATLANVAGSASNVTLFAANPEARGRYIYNDSTAVLYVKFGATATTSSFTVYMAANSYYEFPQQPLYTGQVDGIWASATGNARTTEV